VAGSECEAHQRKAPKFIELQERQANSSSKGALVNCPWPCNHGFVYNRAAWVSETIVTFLEKHGVLQAQKSD
jgi:hypothetical protein